MSGLPSSPYFAAAAILALLVVLGIMTWRDWKSSRAGIDGNADLYPWLWRAGYRSKAGFVVIIFAVVALIGFVLRGQPPQL